MTDITIPPKALEEAWNAFAICKGTSWDAFEAACLAMLKAWPGVNTDAERCGLLILPLPTEKPNE